MTRHGLLTAPRRGRSSAAPSNVVSDEDLGCELIFEGLIDSEDYHKNMNGQVFMQWVQNRLIPTFKRLFPGKKLILLLDNASYHHPRGDDWINPNKMSKYELAVWISDRADSITVHRDGASKYFGKTSLFQPASRYAPTVEEMRAWVKAYLAAASFSQSHTAATGIRRRGMAAALHASILLRVSANRTSLGAREELRRQADG